MSRFAFDGSTKIVVLAPATVNPEQGAAQPIDAVRAKFTPDWCRNTGEMRMP